MIAAVALAAALLALAPPPAGDDRVAPEPEHAATAAREREDAELLKHLELLERLEVLKHLELFVDPADPNRGK